jgi:trimeric autotransporter adhesin
MPPGDRVSPRRPGFRNPRFPVPAWIVAAVFSTWLCGCGSDKETNPTPPSGVDLLVVTYAPSDPPPLTKPGDPVEMPYWLAENGGDATSGAFSIGYYLSLDGQITTQDALLDTLASAGLAAAHDFTLPNSVTIPAGTAPGTYYLGVLLDRNGSVQESNETNNTRAVLVDVTPLPDLLVPVAPAPAPVAAAPGGSVTLNSWTIWNRGTAASASCEYGYYLSTNAGIDTFDVYLGAGSAPSVPAYGTSIIDAANITIPAGTTPGDYFVGVLVDRGGAVDEFSEANNGSSVAFRVKERPDLIVSSGPITATPTTVSAGDVVAMSAGTIQNTGEPLPFLTSFHNGFYLSTDSNITASDEYLAPALGPLLYFGPIVFPDPYRWEAASVRIPSDTPPGSYYIGVLVDRTDTISERDETNNDVATPITVQP